MTKCGPAKRPCASCPYRRDAPSGLWADEEYDKLPFYDQHELTAESPVGAFFCHQQTGRLCAGWVGCHDMANSLQLRLTFLHGHLDTEDVDAALDYVSPVPLWGSGAEAAEHGKAEIESPGPKARRAIDKLERQRQRREQRNATDQSSETRGGDQQAEQGRDQAPRG